MKRMMVTLLSFFCAVFASADSFALLNSSVVAVPAAVQENQKITVEINIEGNESYGYFFIDVIFDNTQIQVSNITVHSPEFAVNTIDQANANQKVHLDYLSMGTGISTVKVATIEFTHQMLANLPGPVISGSWQVDAVSGYPPASYTGTYDLQVAIVDCIKGDVDGIEGIDIRDVRYLLYHVRGYAGYEELH